jgi:hypothetical protein
LREGKQWHIQKDEEHEELALEKPFKKIKVINSSQMGM